MRMKLTEETIKRLCEAIEAGSTVKTACAVAGIGKSSYYRWKEESLNAKTGLLRDFREHTSQSLAKARANLERAVFQIATEGYEETITREETKPDGSRVIVTITRTIPPNGRLALKILEKRFPEAWAPKGRKGFTLKGKGEQSINLFKLNSDVHLLTT